MDCPQMPFEPVVRTILRCLHVRPDHCAIRFCGADITNAALLTKVLRIAGHLPEAGISRGTRVGVCFERGPETLALLLALWVQGAVYVPLDPALPRERLFAMCGAAGLELLISSSSLQALVSHLPCPLLVLEAIVFEAPQEQPAVLPCPSFAADSGDLAYILFTSGSSGAPKGVQISQGNIAALFAGVVTLLDIAEDCRILGCANFSFDISFFELLAPLLCGGTLVLADQQACATPSRLVQLLERERVTVVQATPSHWQLLNAQAWTASIRVAIATGEALPRAVATGILQHAATLWNLYGPTECTVWASAHRVEARDLTDDAPPVVSIGAALPGYTLELSVLDELVIGGVGVGLGYCDQAFPAASFQSSTYRSGDLCRRDSRGLLHYQGRRDNQVKHNGYRIELDEIALLLQQHMSISQAVCLLKPATSTTNSLLFACVVFRPGMPNKNKTTLNDHLSAHLPTWMLPQRYFFLDRLPLTSNSKLDRAALHRLADPVQAGNRDGSLESQVAQVFCDVLDVKCIGPCDSFLDAGGSSMLAATLVLTLNERLGCALTLRQALHTPPTVNSILQLLDATTAPSLEIRH